MRWVNQGRYTSFPPRVPHQDPVAAEHINSLQRVSQWLQDHAFATEDIVFAQRMIQRFSSFARHNVLRIELFDTESRIDWRRSVGVRFDAKERALVLDEAATIGIAYLPPYQSPKYAALKDLMVVAEGRIPAGTFLRFEVSANGTDFVPLPMTATPGPYGTTYVLHEPVDPPTGTALWLRVVFERAIHADVPRLDRLAYSLFDPSYHQEIRIPVEEGEPVRPIISHDELIDVRPDSHHPWPIRLDQDVVGILPPEHLPPELFDQVPEGDTVLYRDAQGRLVRVDTPADRTTLLYDSDTGRLAQVVTATGTTATVEDLFYDDQGLLVKVSLRRVPLDELDPIQTGEAGTSA